MNDAAVRAHTRAPRRRRGARLLARPGSTGRRAGSPSSTFRPARLQTSVSPPRAEPADGVNRDDAGGRAARPFEPRARVARRGRRPATWARVDDLDRDVSTEGAVVSAVDDRAASAPSSSRMSYSSASPASSTGSPNRGVMRCTRDSARALHVPTGCGRRTRPRPSRSCRRRRAAARPRRARAGARCA